MNNLNEKQKIQFTILDTNQPTKKEYTYKNGQFTKSVLANLYSSVANRVELDTPHEHFLFLSEIKNDPQNFCVVSGVAKNKKESNSLVSRKNKTKNTISRTKQDFIFSNNVHPILLDIDSEHEDEQDFFNVLAKINPSLKDKQFAKSVFPSNSCSLFHNETRLTSDNKKHVYVYMRGIENLTSEQRTNFIKRLKINGLATGKVNKIGSFSLVISAFDESPFLSQERLEFLQKGIYHDGIEQRAFAPYFNDGEIIEITPDMIKSLTNNEIIRYNQIYNAFKNANKSKIEEVKSHKIAEFTSDFIKLGNDEKTAKRKAKQKLARLHRQEIALDDMLLFDEDKKHYLVSDILQDIAKNKENSRFFGNNNFFPYEDESRDNACAGFTYYKGRIHFSSFSSGKIFYKIVLPKKTNLPVLQKHDSKEKAESHNINDTVVELFDICKKNYEIEEVYSIRSQETHHYAFGEFNQAKMNELMKQHKILLNVSKMGAGKTELLLNRKDMVFISSNVSLATNASSRLAIEHYQDFQSASKKDMAVCINSIMKIDLDGVKNKTIVADEITQIITAISHGTVGDSKYTRKDILNYLKTLFSLAKNVIILDADANEETLSFLKNVCDDDIYIFDVEKNPEHKNKEIIAFQDDVKMQELFIDAIEKGKVVDICGDNKKKLGVLFETLKKLFPDKKGLFISSDTQSLHENQEFLKNPNIDFDFLIRSPTITTGISRIKPVDYVFGFNSNVVSIQQFAQQLCRSRVVNENYIVSLKNHDYDCETDLDEMMDKLKNEIKIANNTVGDEEIKEIIFDKEKEMYEFIARQKIIQNKFREMSFTDKVNYLAEKLDTTVVDMRTFDEDGNNITTNNAILSELNQLSRAEIKQNEIDMLVKAEILSQEEYECISSKNNQSVEEQYNMQKTIIANTLAADELSIADIEFGLIENNIKKLKNLDFANMSLSEVKRHKRNQLAKYRIDSKEIQIKAVSNLLRKFNIEFNEKEIILTEKEINKIYKNIISVKNKKDYIESGLIDKRDVKQETESKKEIKKIVKKILTNFGYCELKNKNTISSTLIMKISSDIMKYHGNRVERRKSFNDMLEQKENNKENIVIVESQKQKDLINKLKNKNINDIIITKDVVKDMNNNNNFDDFAFDDSDIIIHNNEVVDFKLNKQNNNKVNYKNKFAVLN